MDALGAVLLARHGETDDNAGGRLQGHRDPPLNPRGRNQARALAEALAGEGLASLWSSPLRRALETADIVGRALGLGPPRVDARLMEVDVGDWAGRTLDEVREHEPALVARWRARDPAFRVPGGESLAEQVARVAAALADVRASGDLPALVVCHGGTIRAALHGAGAPPRIANGSVHRLDLPPAQAVSAQPAPAPRPA